MTQLSASEPSERSRWLNGQRKNASKLKRQVAARRSNERAAEGKARRLSKPQQIAPTLYGLSTRANVPFCALTARINATCALGGSCFSRMDGRARNPGHGSNASRN